MGLQVGAEPGRSISGLRPKSHFHKPKLVCSRMAYPLSPSPGTRHLLNKRAFISSSRSLPPGGGTPEPAGLGEKGEGAPPTLRTHSSTPPDGNSLQPTALNFLPSLRVLGKLGRRQSCTKCIWCVCGGGASGGGDASVPPSEDAQLHQLCGPGSGSSCYL